MDKTVARIPVTLNSEDDALMRQLRIVLETKLEKRLSVAAIVRMALRELASAHNID